MSQIGPGALTEYLCAEALRKSDGTSSGKPAVDQCLAVPGGMTPG